MPKGYKQRKVECRNKQMPTVKYPKRQTSEL